MDMKITIAKAIMENEKKYWTWKGKRRDVVKAKKPDGTIHSILIESDPLSGKVIVLQRDRLDPKEVVFLRRSE